MSEVQIRGYYRVSPVIIRHPHGRGRRSLRYQEVSLLSSIVFQRWGTMGNLWRQDNTTDLQPYFELNCTVLHL